MKANQKEELDFLTDRALKIRRALLGSCAVGLFVTLTGSMPDRIVMLNLEFSETSKIGMVCFLILCILYLLVSFRLESISGLSKWLDRSTSEKFSKARTDEKEFLASHASQELRKAKHKAALDLPELMGWTNPEEEHDQFPDHMELEFEEIEANKTAYHALLSKEAPSIAKKLEKLAESQLGLKDLSQSFKIKAYFDLYLPPTITWLVVVGLFFTLFRL